MSEGRVVRLCPDHGGSDSKQVCLMCRRERNRRYHERHHEEILARFRANGMARRRAAGIGPPISVPVGVRFWAKVALAKPTECWEWTGSRTTNGYGQLMVARRPKRAHRISWEMTYGPIPFGLEICHTCDNRGCVNPFHMFLGTRKDNMQDASRKGRVRGNTRPRKARRYRRAKSRQAQCPWVQPGDRMWLRCQLREGHLHSHRVAADVRRWQRPWARWAVAA